MVFCDGLCDYEWSDMAEEETNYALLAKDKPKGPNFTLMAYASSSSGSDFEVPNEFDKFLCYFKSCLDTVEELKTGNESLRQEVESLKLDNLGYKVRIQNVERKLEYLKKM